MVKEDLVEIYTDGACRGNPGPGGWGALLRYHGHERRLMGATAHTTNNQMELLAAIEALKALRRPMKVMLYTDSKYVQKGISEWVNNWRKNNWKTADKKPVKNVELWQALLQESAKHQIEWHWVKGHNGHVYNDCADALARQAIDQFLLKGQDPCDKSS